MAHMVSSIAYTGKTPWHKIGNKLPINMSIEDWIIAAGLNWSIEESPVMYRTVGGSLAKMPDRKVLHRSDNWSPLSVVSGRYKVVQPRDVLEFFRDIVSDDIHLDVAGTLQGGKKIWALAKSDSQITLGGVDNIETYLLFVTSCDGSSATRVYETTVRVVCNNTLQMSASDAHRGVTVRHNTTFDADSVKTKLGLDSNRIVEFHDEADNLASRGISDKQAVNFFAELYGKRDDDGVLKVDKRLEKLVNDVMMRFKSGAGADLITARGTQWGALNAVTNHIDFASRAHNNENRFISAQFGNGNDIKNNAREMLLDNVYLDHSGNEITDDSFESLLSR